MPIVYSFTSPSGKKYIGLTSSTMERRWRQHVTLYNKLARKGLDYRGASATPILFYAFDKYEPKLWERKVLFETDNLEEAKEKEIYYIALFDTTNRNMGYNVLIGGQTGWAGKNLSEDHKEAQSKSRSEWYETNEGIERKKELSQLWSAENNPSKLRIGLPGTKHTDQSKEKIRQSKIGKIYSEETRNKKRIKMKTFYNSEKGQLLIQEKKTQIVSEDQKQRISKKLMGHKTTETQRKAATEANSMDWLVTTPDGVELKITNLRQFCKENKLSQGNLVTYGKTKGFKVVKL